MKKATFILILIVLFLCSCENIDNHGSDVNNQSIEEVKSTKSVQTATIVNKTVQESINPATYLHIDENNEEINVLGNTYGNIANGGYAALYEGYIYYANGSDTGGSSDNKIYRVSLDGNDKTKLSDDKGELLNVMNGYVYFSNKSDGYKLYRMKIDGTEKEKLTEKGVDCVITYGRWVYYTFFYDGGLYKMDLHNMKSEAIKISDDRCGYLNIVGDWIYYNNFSEGSRIYRIKTDGSSKQKLCDDEISELIFYDGYLYYNNLEDECRIYRINTEGLGKSLICDHTCLSFNISDGFIYYANYWTEKGLYKMKLDGTQKEIINDDRTDCINIVGEWIYYDAVFAEHSDQYRIKIDGTHRQKVEPIN